MVPIVRVDTKGNPNAVTSTSGSPPTPTDIAHRVNTIAAAILRDQTGAINGCGETIL